MFICFFFDKISSAKYMPTKRHWFYHYVIQTKDKKITKPAKSTENSCVKVKVVTFLLIRKYSLSHFSRFSPHYIIIVIHLWIPALLLCIVDQTCHFRELSCESSKSGNLSIKVPDWQTELQFRMVRWILERVWKYEEHGWRSSPSRRKVIICIARDCKGCPMSFSVSHVKVKV